MTAPAPTNGNQAARAYDMSLGQTTFQRIRRVSNYQHRPDLEQLCKNKLRDGRHLIIHGLPGSGKTQLARTVFVEYCPQEAFRHEIDATSRETVADSIDHLLERFRQHQLIDPVPDDIERKVRLVMNHLNEARNPILLLDDYTKDTYEFFLNQGLFDTDSGMYKVIATTHQQGTHPENIEPILVGKFKEEEAINFFKKDNTSSNENDADIIKLCESIDYLPLALVTAKSKILSEDISIKEYLEELSDEEANNEAYNAEALKECGYNKTLYSALATAIQEAKKSLQGSAKQLAAFEMLAFMASKNFPLDSLLGEVIANEIDGLSKKDIRSIQTAIKKKKVPTATLR